MHLFSAVLLFSFMSYAVESIKNDWNYANPNIKINTTTDTLFATNDIPMGTIIAIQHPLINHPSNFTTFVETFYALWHQDPEFTSFIISLPNVDTDTVMHCTQSLLNSLPNHLKSPKKHALDESFLIQTMQHLSWKSILYQILPSIRIGFDANVAIFENNDCIVIMAASDLKKGEKLIQPLNLFSKMMYSTPEALLKFDLDLYKEKIKIHLDDYDKQLVDTCWDDFVFIDESWKLFKCGGEMEYFHKTLTSFHFQTLFTAMYKDAFAPEIMMGLDIADKDTKGTTGLFVFGMIEGTCKETLFKKTYFAAMKLGCVLVDSLVCNGSLWDNVKFKSYLRKNQDAFYLKEKDDELANWFLDKGVSFRKRKAESNWA